MSENGFFGKKEMAKKVLITLLSIAAIAASVALELIRSAYGEPFSLVLIACIAGLVILVLIILFAVPYLIKINDIKDLEVQEVRVRVTNLEGRTGDQRELRSNILGKSLDKILSFADNGNLTDANQLLCSIEWLESIAEERDPKDRMRAKTDAVLDSMKDIFKDTQEQVSANTTVIRVIAKQQGVIAGSVNKLIGQIDKLTEMLGKPTTELVKGPEPAAVPAEPVPNSQG